MRTLPASPACVVLAACLLSCATVEVSAPVPRPPQVPQPVEAPSAPRLDVSWEVVPAGGCGDERGFVRLEYQPCPPGPAQFDEDPFPPGGKLTVHLGYRDLRDANTALYAFEVTEAGGTLLAQHGQFDVPNIKGPDGYWWNDVVLDLPVQVAAEATVTVTESRSARACTFILRRVETAETAPVP